MRWSDALEPLKPLDAALGLPGLAGRSTKTPHEILHVGNLTLLPHEGGRTLGQLCRALVSKSE